MDIKIRNMIIEIEYCVSYGLVIFVTNYYWFLILEIGRHGRNDEPILKDTLYVNELSSFIFKLN